MNLLSGAEIWCPLSVLERLNPYYRDFFKEKIWEFYSEVPLYLGYSVKPLSLYTPLGYFRSSFSFWSIFDRRNRRHEAFSVPTLNDRFCAAALISFPLSWCVALISTTGKTLREIYRELNDSRTSYAQFNIKYVHLELLYEPGFRSFQRYNSRVVRDIISQKRWFWYLFISSAVNKVESLFVNAQIGAAARIKVGPLLGSGVYSSSGA